MGHYPAVLAEAGLNAPPPPGIPEPGPEVRGPNEEGGWENQHSRPAENGRDFDNQS